MKGIGLTNNKDIQYDKVYNIILISLYNFKFK